MKEPRPDDERLSALLDGRLAGPERDALLAHLAAHDEDYEVFVDTADVLREAEAEGAGGDVRVPWREGRRTPPRAWPAPRRWMAPRWIALAAAVAGLVVLAALAQGRRAGAAGHPVHLAARLEHAEQGLPEGWTERRPWTSARGGAAGGRAVRAAQAGALLVDLSVTVAAGDSAGTSLLATQLRQRFDPQAAPSSPLPRIAARAGEPRDALRPLLQQATERLEERLGRDHLRLGAWAEAAKMAARRRDAAFFRSGATRGMLGRAERLTAADPAAREALSRVRAALAGGGPPHWDALEAGVDALLAALAS